MNNTVPHTILMTADTIGGVWNYSLILTKALQQYDVEVHLATMGNLLSTDQWQEASKISNLIIHESDYALEWMENPWFEIEQAGKWLMNLEKKIQPDLIHLNNYAFANLLWNSPVLTVGHSCVLSWWEAVKKENAPVSWHEYAFRVKNGLQQSDIVISVSKYMLSELNRLYGPFTLSKVIYNAQFGSNFTPGKKYPELFSIGRIWDEAKNIRLLQEISADLSWPVLIAGDHHGTYNSSNENSHFLGKLPAQEIAFRLSRASIYVHPARYEPFGLSVLEAALSGCALVLGDIPSLKEIWQDTALYVPPDNPEKFKVQVQRLINQPKFRKIMAEKAHQKAQTYSVNRMRELYRETYSELLKNNKQDRKQVLEA